MKFRLLFAVGFVVLVSGLIVARDKGFLGGREPGGPLALSLGSGQQRVERGQAARFAVKRTLAGGDVRVQNVRPRVASPELLLDKTAGERPLEDAQLGAGPAPPIRLALSAPRAGLYYAVGLIVDYRRGQRRFRDREASTLCIAVRTRQRCDLGYKGPGEAHVVQVGGPSRYRGARFTATRATYRAPGTYVAHITIVNRTRSAIAVSAIGLDSNPAVRVTAAGFRLAPRGVHGVTLHITATRCGHETFDRLRAELDGDRRSIPLSLPLAFSGC